jgi:GT2 family glycosyltransferase
VAGEPFRLPLRRSLIERLTETLRGGCSPGTARLLRPVRDALGVDAPGVALRALDRAWRSLPDESRTIAPLYACMLMLDSHDFDAVLCVAQVALELGPDAEVAATRVLALLQLGKFAEARLRLDSALADYCVAPTGALACAAADVMRHPAIDAPGWIGLAPTLALVGQVTHDEPTRLTLGLGEDPRDTHTVQLAPGGVQVLRHSMSRSSAALQRIAHCAGVPLLGSGARTADDFRLDGRAQHRGRTVTAWVRLGCLPSEAPRLRFVDDHGGRTEAQPAGSPLPGWRWPCAVNLRAARLRGSRIHVAARLPDGRWQPLPDAPLLLSAPMPRVVRGSPPRRDPAARRTAQRRTVKRRTMAGPTAKRRIDIIIPVYGNRDETLACIESVSRTVGALARLVVVDDASIDPVLVSALDALGNEGQITLLRNSKNLGFAGAVNRALAHDPSRDAVLLNSDTRVFGDWLVRMQAAAYSEATVGTVTPWSNSGSIASYPQTAGATLEPDSAAALHALAAATHAGKRFEIPVGVGFCLYLRRDCLLDVGTLDVGGQDGGILDAAVFGKGYGEETDFCLRARRRGWTHRLAADVYVFHASGHSFGARRAALLDRSQRLLNLRHPGYDRSIERFLARDPLRAARRDLDAERLRAHAGRNVLIVTLALGGGVDRFVKERSRLLRALGFTPILLRACGPDDARGCELVIDDPALPNLRYDIPGEMRAIEALLTELRFEAIELQHFLHLDPRLIDVVRRLPAGYEVFVHDYAWLCPRVTLIDGSGRYCGEPAIRECETCVKRNGSNLGEAITVEALRKRSAAWLGAARRVLAPSEDTAARLRRYFPGIDVEVRPHAPPMLPTPRPPRDPVRPHLRIALIGAIGAHKGYDVLLECARDARTRRLPLEFVVIGYTENDSPLLATGKVFITGPYIDGEAPHLIERERPDIAWLPSVWPETWCYTLDYALTAGLPVVAFDLGAIAERLRAAPHAVLFPMGTPSQRINDGFLGFANDAPNAAYAAPNSVKSLPAPPPEIASIDALTVNGMCMARSSNGKAADGTETGLAASVQVLPLTAGLYLFSVKAANPTNFSGTGQLTLPAMHVGLGPGVRSDQVEFISSPSTHGAWLFAATDLLVTRVNASGATLVLTSVRAPTGDVLSIKVERLDTRTDVAATAAQAVPPATLTAPAPPLEKLQSGPPAAAASLSVHIVTHVRTRGDLQFVDAPWAGRVGPGLWIESFTVRPLEHLSAHDVEYKGLTGSGFETPWLSDNSACGTKGMSVPLVGFAVRLRPTAATAPFDCEYSGYFQSGLTVGPLRNGAPCRSSVANDPLEGIQVRLVRRASTATMTPVGPTYQNDARSPSRGAGNGNGNGASQRHGVDMDNANENGNGNGNGKSRKSAGAKTKVPSLTIAKPGKRAALAR